MSRAGVASGGVSMLRVAALGVLAACGARSRPDAGITITPRSSGAVVARVGDGVVTTDDVQAVARAERIADARRALERAIELRLLASEATRRGLERDPLVRDTARRATLQVLLERTVETTERIETLPRAELDEGVQIRGFDLAHGPLRAAEHVLVRFPANAPAAERARLREGLEAARRELLAQPLPRAPNALERAGSAALPGLPPCSSLQSVSHACRRHEALPAADDAGRHARGNPLVPPFAAELATLSTPGDVSRVIETSFGFHLIVLREVLPPLVRSDAEVRRILSEELLWRRRANALDRYLDELRARYQVAVREQALRAAETARLDPEAVR